MTNLNGTSGNGFKYQMEAFTTLTNANPSVMNGVWQLFLNNDAFLKMIVESVTDDVEVLNNWKSGLNLSNLTNRVFDLELAVGGLDARLDALELNGTGSGSTGSSGGVTIQETSSAAWTVPNAGVVPRFAYLYLQPPANVFAVPVAAEGYHPQDSVSPGFMGKPCIITRNLGSEDGYSVPTDVVTIKWAILTPATASAPAPTTPTQWTSFTGGDTLYVSNQEGQYTNQSVKTFAITRPAAAPAGSMLRISGRVNYIGSGGHNTYMTLTAIVGGVRHLIENSPYATVNGETFEMDVFPDIRPWIEQGNWTLECKYSVTDPGSLGNDMDAGLQFTLKVEYRKP